eukprot:1479659-Heterocapsa_arctica.AAC.1
MVIELMDEATRSAAAMAQALKGKGETPGAVDFGPAPGSEEAPAAQAGSVSPEAADAEELRSEQRAARPAEEHRQQAVWEPGDAPDGEWRYPD